MNRPKTLFVHIGAHKTGSTAIQSYFNRHLMILRCLGADLEVPRQSSRWFIRKVKNRDIMADLKASGDDDDFTTRSGYLERIANSRSGKFLISAESFCRHARAPEYFLPFTSVCRVRIVMFLRRQDRYMESFYRQMVKHQGKLVVESTFQAYFQKRVEKGPRHQSLNWERCLEPWQEAFGEENITVVPYAEGRGFDSISEIGKVLSVPVSIRLPFGRNENPSVSCETIEMVRRLSSEGRTLDASRIRAFDSAVPHPTFAYFTDEQRRAVVASFEESNRNVGRRYGCDMYPLLPSSLPPASAGRTFDERAFDYEGLLPLAARVGLIR